MSEAQMPGRRIGPVVLDLKNISLSFGGVKALTDISFNVETGFRDVFYLGLGTDYIF